MSNFKKGTKIQFDIQASEFVDLKKITTVFIMLINGITVAKRFFLIKGQTNDSIQLNDDKVSLTITAEESALFDTGSLDAAITIKYEQEKQPGYYDICNIRKTGVATITAE